MADVVEALAERILAEPNKNYKKSGLQSYVWLLQKYNIKPTLDGPYFRPKGSAWLDRQRNGGLRNLRRHTHRHHTRFPSEKPPEEHPPKVKTTTRATGATVPADDQQNDSLYLCPVIIGGQKVMLDFDSGSSDLWVMSTHLDPMTQANLKKTNHTIYDPLKSKDMKPATGQSWSIEYGDGSKAGGDVVTDTLVVGAIPVKAQAIECARYLSPAFSQTAGDGLLGLAMGAINTVKPKRVNTPVENMISQYAVPQNFQLFTCWLSSWKDLDEDDEGKSFYTFGAIDQLSMQRCGATDFYWTPLVNQDKRGFWEFKSATYTLNDQVSPRTSSQAGGNTAIADTGTTLALVDDATCAAIYKAIPGSRYDYPNQGYVIPSDIKEDQLPNVGFDVGGKTFFIPKEAILFAETEPGWCYGGIQSRGDLPFDIWGDTWLKGVYAAFDVGNKRFGCVQRTLKSQNMAVR